MTNVNKAEKKNKIKDSRENDYLKLVIKQKLFTLIIEIQISTKILGEYRYVITKKKTKSK